MALTVVHAASIVCWPWHLRCIPDHEKHPKGGNCRDCARDVAVPVGAVGDPVCLYCAMDQGLVEMIEQPLFAASDGEG